VATIAVAPRSVASQLKDELAYMACGLWMITGLYLDGWSHQANKPESFFTPWHLLLYSGFGAAVVYSGWIGVRDARHGTKPVVGEDRITTLGVALFALGAGGDFVWHSLVGIEVDVEGLISPTHLALMIGGLLMVTLPVRSALHRDEVDAPLPVVASVALALGVLAFFLMYLMPWDATYAFVQPYVPESDSSNADVVIGMASLLVATTLFIGSVLWTARRWRLPFGTATVTFTSVAFAVCALDGFDVRLPILAGTIAGIVVDLLLTDGRPLSQVGLAGGFVLSAAFLALQHAEGGVGWGPSLWGGAIVFSALAGYGVGTVLSAGSAGAAPASSRPAA
jgi:hypothetical protein